jgi:hypothetical protein
MWQFVVGILLFLISASALTLSIFAFIRSNKVKTDATKTASDLDKWILEVKSHMSNLIKDINVVNEQNYNFDVSKIIDPTSG